MNAESGPVPSAYEGACVDYADHKGLDITDDQAVSAWFQKTDRYDLVINCAAATNVDKCEVDEAATLKVNALGPMYLARACEARESTFVHISTNYVFPGNVPAPQSENDPVGPLSAYGRSKLAGELLALDSCKRTHIIRTAWLYGYVGSNIVKTMLRIAREHGRVSVVNDQYGNPTSANDLALSVLRIALTDEYGVWHCVNEGSCSWFDFTCAALDMAGVECEREPITTIEYKRRVPDSACRPIYSSLDNKRLNKTVGIKMRPWQEALADYIANLDTLGG